MIRTVVSCCCESSQPHSVISALRGTVEESLLVIRTANTLLFSFKSFKNCIRFFVFRYNTSFIRCSSQRNGSTVLMFASVPIRISVCMNGGRLQLPVFDTFNLGTDADACD